MDVREAVVEGQHHAVPGVAGAQRGHGVVEGGDRLVGQGVDLGAELLRRDVELVA